MTTETEQTIDLETQNLYAMYADGFSVVDIGSHFGITPQTVYKKLAVHPDKRAEAKEQRAQLRIAKYRRVGALALDLKLRYLENFPDDPELLMKEIRNIDAIGESAEKRADLNEGKPTERIDTMNDPLTQDEIKQLAEELQNAGNGLDHSSLQ